MKYKGVPLLPMLTAAAATTVFVRYRASMRATHKRLRGKSKVIPTLLIHAQDDTLQPYRNAEFFATTIPDARLLSFQKAGHIIALIKTDEGSPTVQKHILANPNEPYDQFHPPESTEV